MNENAEDEAIRERAKRLASGDYSRTYPSEPEKSTYREEVRTPSTYQSMPEGERKAVKARREALGLSRASMAKAAGVTTAFIDQMEINGYGAKDKQTLVITTIEKLEMEKEMAYTPKATPEIRAIRRDNLRHILDYFGAPARLSEAFPVLNKSSIDNIIKYRNGMGSGNARRWEVVLNLPDGWFDQSRSVVPDHLVARAGQSVPADPEEKVTENNKHEEEPTVRHIGTEKKEAILNETEEPGSAWFIEIPVDISDSGRVIKSLADAGYQRITLSRR
jgi:transcriptional regulator with XRE-family HTH domain